jgi:hypothetical protein
VASAFRCDVIMFSMFSRFKFTPRRLFWNSLEVHHIISFLHLRVSENA